MEGFLPHWSFERVIYESVEDYKKVGRSDILKSSWFVIRFDPTKNEHKRL